MQEKNTQLKTALLKDTIPSEDYEQMMLVQWFRRTHKDVLIFSIPLGGHRHPAVAAKLKATGTVPGIPDLFVPEWKLWIEMKKVKGGKISPEQQGMIDYLQSVGYCVIVGLGAEDARRKISQFIKETQ